MSTSTRPSYHGQLIMGKKNLYICHLPMFYMPEHAVQAITMIEFDSKHLENYIKIKDENPQKPLIILNKDRNTLEDTIKSPSSSSFLASVYFANENGDPMGDPLLESVNVTVQKNILFKHLDPQEEYPSNLTYYLYGKNGEFHLSHLLSKHPNFQQEIDVIIKNDTCMYESDSLFVKVYFPSLKEKDKHPIKNDPLSEDEYTIKSEDGKDFNIIVKHRYWINNGPLNHKQDSGHHHHHH